MRKTILIFTLLLSIAGTLRAQPDEAVLVDRFGAIRADMVREICYLSGIDDDELLKWINNESLTPFKKHIKNDTLKIIIGKAKSLYGNDVNQYVKNLHETQQSLLNQFGLFYPDKKAQAEQCFKKYTDRINSVSNEFNPSAEKTVNSESSEIKTLAASKHKKAKESKASNLEFFLKAIFWLLGIIAAIALTLVTLSILRKRKSHHGTAMLEREKRRDPEVLKNSEKPVEETHPIIEDRADEQSEIITQPEEDVQPTTHNEKGRSFIQMDGNGCSTAANGDEWIVVGASVQGNGHIEMEIPCQDNHAYEYLSDGWGIAIVSDGAGSAKLSHKGSAAVVARSMFHFKSLISQEGWISKHTLPSDGDWMKLSYQVLKQVHGEIGALSKHLDCQPKDLNATIIVVIHSPFGLLTVHVGDGRAGYKDMNGNWHSLMTPHKGEEANQTIFMMSGFWGIPFFELSGVMVPESKVLPTPVTAFTLMSDGCEHTAWLCNQYDEETGKYYDPNLPFPKFFNSLIETLRAFRRNNTTLRERQEKWYNFIKKGNQSFVRETDDKTMILATLYNLPQKP